MYAANTAGAMVGALLATFLLIPLLGVRGTGFAAAVLNLLAAAGALGLDGPVTARVTATARPEPVRVTADARVAVGLYALAGGIALGYEVVWSQAIVQFMSTRSFAFSVVLATYLAGLVTGAALYARAADRVSDPWGTFGVLIAAAGMVAVLEMAGLGRWSAILQTQAEAAALALTGSVLVGMCIRFSVAAACIVFLPTVLLGAAFPAALRLTVDAARSGRDVGAVVALNTVGGVAGTIFIGFVLVPALGLVHTLAVLAIAAAAVGLLAVMRSPGVRPGARWAAVAIGVVTVAVGALTPADRLAHLFPGARSGTLAFYLEVFPHATLWTTEVHERLLIGSADPIELDVPRVAARISQPAVAAALRDVGIASPAAPRPGSRTGRGLRATRTARRR